ncbi:MAG: flagellar brake protein [Mycobacterium leprae]
MLCYTVCAALMEGPVRPADIRSVEGLPGRLFFAEPRSPGPVRMRNCSVLKVGRHGVVVALEGTEGPLPEADDSVVLEVAHKNSLIQCFTSVVSAPTSQAVTLRRPPSLHVLQRRRYPRIDVFLGVTVYTPEQTLIPVAGQMINLSVDGAAIVMAEPLIPDSVITVDLTASGLEPSHLRARVVRCSPSPNHLWVNGVQFQELLPDQEQFLAEYINHRACPQG